ncbi:MAG: UDP-N-acetylmuramate--L-alanine ligase [Actinobacteria bacterium]|nr:UDP-N-acetylmuramate--L-alanine ligase [Actinomycetota bacterium]MCL6105323.1 UDP-N-acetylmuramate--L-alanine ligase [Actinomycetota bacterium]
MSTDLDLSKSKRVHIVGIGGAGMSAIAVVLASMGHTVSGSDLKYSDRVEKRLNSAGIKVYLGHDPTYVTDAEVLAVSTAIPSDNPEVDQARARGIPVLCRADILKAICALKKTVAVAGTHGKTTTSFMLALILLEAGWHPSYIIGGQLKRGDQEEQKVQKDTGDVIPAASWDTGEWLVVEADESDGTFLKLNPTTCLVTNIEADHLDYWHSPDHLKEGFYSFFSKVSGTKVIGITAVDPEIADRKLSSGFFGRNDVLTYGLTPDCDYQAVEIENSINGSVFSVVANMTDSRGHSQVVDNANPKKSPSTKSLMSFELFVPGMHNVCNALGALSLAIALGVDFQAIKRGLQRFLGVARRFEFRGSFQGITFIDDYAHLPSEVTAALATAKLGNWKRIVCVFQPHRYSRTERLRGDFADAFRDADLLVLTDIYSAGEQAKTDISGKLILDAVLGFNPLHNVAWLPTRDELIAYLKHKLKPGDLCLTLGAGDITLLPDQVISVG